MALEGIVALSLVCNVMQVIRYGGEAVELVNQIHKMGGSVQVAELDLHAAHIASAVDALQGSMQTVGRNPKDSGGADLYDISQRCLVHANDLQQSIASIPRGRRKRDIFGIALWILRKRSNVDRIRQQLDMYQHDLDTHILVNLSSKIDAQSLQIPNLDMFRKEFGELLRGLTSRQRESLEAANRLDGNSTREAIATSSSNTINLIDSRLNEIQKQPDLSKRYYQAERLLSSLEYPSMNARRNQIPLPHTETFNWPFRNDRLVSETGVQDWEIRWDPLDTWLETGQGIYWINGKAGSGKSTLMKHLVKSRHTLAALKKWAEPSRLILLSHYFWTAGNKYEKVSKV